LVCVVAGILLVGMGVQLARGRVMESSTQLEKYLAAAREHQDYPIVTTDERDFTGLAFYLRPGDRVSMLTDEWYSGSPSGTRIAPALARHYFPGTMRTLPEFLADHDRFLIVGGGTVSQSLAHVPEWQGREIANSVWTWQRRQ
jgi:hypothetical protein